MKKSSFVAMMLGTVSGVMFALGMCMALVEEWNALKPGIIFGSIGIVLGLITLMIWRKMEGKKPIKLNRKKVFTIFVTIVGALTLGVGMCFCLVWGRMIIGTVIGLAGILILLSLIPLIKGIK